MCTTDRIRRDARLLCRVAELENDPACLEAVARVVHHRLTVPMFAQPEETPTMKHPARFTITSDREYLSAKTFLPKLPAGSVGRQTVQDAMTTYLASRRSEGGLPDHTAFTATSNQIAAELIASRRYDTM